ncbi:hypothetical protein SANTM175S_09804 [Streptomyces antimycoticus]
MRVKADTDDAVLFAKVYDVGPDGRQVLPEQLVTPLRVTGVKQGRTVTVRLPAVDHELIAGHRLRLVLASTDLGYASPTEPATYTVGLVDGGLTVPTASAVHTQPAPLPAWVWGLPLAAAVVALGLVLTGRRRTATPAPDPELAGVPLQITGLSKRYAKSADRYAVRELSFRVEKGQVLGLLGPNGAGKTTTLRMLMGLIAPDEGEIRVFGQAIRPGAPGALPCRRLRRGGGLPAASDRQRQPGAVLAGHRPSRRRRPYRGGAGDRGPGQRAGACGAHLLPGHAAAARHRPGHAGPARSADPRRTDQRPRPSADPRDARGDDPVRRRGAP